MSQRNCRISYPTSRVQVEYSRNRTSVQICTTCTREIFEGEFRGNSLILKIRRNTSAKNTSTVPVQVLPVVQVKVQDKLLNCTIPPNGKLRSQVLNFCYCRTKTYKSILSTKNNCQMWKEKYKS
jgi:hypothetical protein